jgi:hypothetical protein
MTAGRPGTLRTAGGAGLLAVVAYVLTTVVGAAVTPGYSHVVHPISELTSSLAPHRAGLAAGYVVYNLSCGAFAWALYRGVDPSRPAAAATGLTLLGALSGIGQVTAFPQDTMGTPATSAGAVHIALAGLSALITVVATVLYGLALRRDPAAGRLARFSFACTAAILATGPGAAVLAGTPWMGLAERLPIGTFLVWLAGCSAWALRAPGEA